MKINKFILRDTADCQFDELIEFEDYVEYEKLLIEDERPEDKRPNECENIIDEMIEYLKKQKTDVEVGLYE